MGWLSAGNSSSNTTTVDGKASFADMHDNSAATNVSGINQGKKSSLNLNVLDGGAIKSAFDFAGQQSSQAYDFSRDLTTKTSAQIADAISAVSESARSETENIFINLQKYALYGLMIWGAVQVLRGKS